MENEERRERVCGCGCKLFLAEETTKHIVINGVIKGSLPTDGLKNFTCLKCSNPELYKSWKHLE